MSREIKFRAWHAETKSKIDWETICQYHDLCELIKSRHILEQYTGLKDKKDVEIYENDILKVHNFVVGRDGMEHDNEFISVITYATDCTCAYWQLEEDCPITSYNGLHEESFEVIGNIHENPELLEVQDA